VPLVAPAQEALVRHRAAQQEQREFFGTDYQDHGLVFCRPDGIPLRPDRVTVEFEQHVAACGLPPCPLHDTRHGACIADAGRRGTDRDRTNDPRRSSPELTRRVYAHLMRSETAAQAEQAAKLLTHHRPALRAAVSNRGRKVTGRGDMAWTAERPPYVSAGGRRSKPGERLGGQGRGRTADLPIFRATVTRPAPFVGGCGAGQPFRPVARDPR
jgi:hypothetical protein